MERRGGTRFALALAFGLWLAFASGQAYAYDWTHSGQPDASEEPEENKEPLTSFAELQRGLPDLDAKRTPPFFVITIPLLAVQVPFQILGVGITADVYPTEWLHLNTHLSAGVELFGDNGAAQYSEASLGVRVLGVFSQREVELSLRRSHGETASLRTQIPSYHGVFLEGGVGTGTLTLFRECLDCVEDALVLEPTKTRQLLWPMLVVRYLYFYDTGSSEGRFRQRAHRQTQLQVLFKPFQKLDSRLHIQDSFDRITRGSFGLQFATDLPTPSSCPANALSLPCLPFRLGAGFFPSPRLFMATLQLQIPALY